MPYTVRVKENLAALRAAAINSTLFAPTTLSGALKKLGFLQADPIKAPAPAQDLILRPRVKDYRSGNLDKNYSRLDIEEDFFYAYGFMPRETWRLLHPRDPGKLSPLEKKVLATAKDHDRLHPRDLEEEFGKARVLNPWGGYSKETTRVLDKLHHHGLLRIVGREKGIRLYQATEPIEQQLSPEERSRALVLLLVNIFSPAPERSLAILPFARPPGCDTRTILQELVGEGHVQKIVVDGVTYLYPRGAARKLSADAPQTVRFLAPFDPLVWDRKRFELLWGWQYRFEAYTPVAKRLRGYYAMPLLWQDQVIGWANVSRGEKSAEIELGYVKSAPRSAAYKRALADEINAFNDFLNY